MLRDKLQLKGLKSQKSSMVALSTLVRNRETCCKYLGAASWFSTKSNLLQVIKRCDEQIAHNADIIRNLEKIRNACQEELVNQALNGTTSVLV